ncbi:MAG: hypothetical protein DRQ62_07605 [Gammaproteobacteria bacterium]|nr:MAG: hypothetical protein DRQ62_07605 [Gammaproteobacteria bacterium]
MNHLETVKYFQLSRKAKEAIKVGLAFSLAITIALELEWMDSYWAGFAVGQVALFPAGQSLHNGALRVVGAMIAVLVALSIFALAPQARWLFAGLTSGWMMFSVYMMLKHERFFYLWNVAGFATLAILGTHQTTSGSIFEYALARGLETTLGIIVYTVVTVLVWPDTNIATLKKGAINLISIQAKSFGLLGSQDGSDKAKKTIRQTIESETQLLIAFKQSFYAKGSETYEVQESAELWEELYTLSIELSQSFKSLNNSSWGLRDIDIVKIIPSLGEYRQEIASRFERAKDILQKGTRELQITPIALEVNEIFLKSLTPFDQLAFASSRKEFEKVANLSQKILECANNIMDDSVTKAPTPKKQVSIYERFIPDIERIKSILFIGSFTFVCFCIWFYFDPPGHMFWIQIPPTVALIVVAIPQMKTNNMIVPAILIYPIFMATDFIIMPQLSKMTELAPLLFISMFCVFYFFTGGHRVLGVVAVTTKMIINNDQVYDFSSSVNMFLVSLGAYISVYIFSYILSSPRPQRALLSLTRRYFRSAAFLMSAIQSNQNKGLWAEFKTAFYRYELRTLPLKIKAWSKAINHKHFPNNSVDEIDELLMNIYSLTSSLEEWFIASHLQQPKHILTETREELVKWHAGIERAFKDYNHNLDSSLSTQMKNALLHHATTLESLINKHQAQIKQLDISEEEKENFYRLVGSYLGLNRSLISYATAAEQISWNHWKEEFFA